MTGRRASTDPRGPILVGGASRSGKTLLRWMLTSHPRIAVSRRTEMWSRFHGRFGDLEDPGNLDRCLAAMLARDQVAALQPDVDRLRRDLATGPATYARLFALLHEQWARRSGKERWGDQSSMVERYADLALAAWPGARLLHLVRDPRDRHAALIEKAGGSVPVTRSVGAWLRSAVLARRNLCRHPEACLVIRYEDLVADPVGMVRAVCAFIGETDHPAMARMAAARRYDRVRAEAPDGIPVTVEEVGRFRGEVAERDLAVIQRAAATHMRAHGYAPVPLAPAHGTAGWVTGLPLRLLAAGTRPAHGPRAVPSVDAGGGW